MTLKEFGEEATIEYELRVLVNDEMVFKTTRLYPEGIEEALGRIERNNFIHNEIVKQYEELPEPIEPDYPEGAL